MSVHIEKQNKHKKQQRKNKQRTWYTESSPVIIHDGVESVGDGDGGTVGKVSANGPLDEYIRLHIHRCRRLVQNQNFSFPQKSSGKANQLSLPNTAIKRKISRQVML